MEESSGVHPQDDKTPPETNKKRTMKTRAQVEALEKLYEEHKYPTETTKEQLAKSIGLTDKQVSGWFCQRRMKDKKLANGEGNSNRRQDRSNAILPDHGSGLKQDSCGSTKKDHFAADLNNLLGSGRTGNFGLPDDTSSGSSASLRNMSVPSDKNVINAACSQYQVQGVPVEMMSVKPRTGPSGYLKVTGRAENPAIAAFKRKLGKYFREDGPPVGVRFDPLPPGAFEPPVQDTQNDYYYAPEHDLLPLQDIPTIGKNPHPRTIYGYNSNPTSHNSDVGLMKVDPVRRRLSSHGITINRGQTQVKATPAECFNYKPSGLTSKGDTSHGFLDKVPPRRMGKGTKLFGQKIPRNDYTDSVHLKDTPRDEVLAAKRIRNEHPQENFRQPSMNQVRTLVNPATQVPRSAAKMPSSFGEDDEAADSTSAD